MRPLDGLAVLVPESRELDLFASMLEQDGATAVRCPLIRILPLTDTRAADEWIDSCIAGSFDDLVLLTGEGLRHLVKIAGPRREAFLSAIGRMRKIVRGPKPARALREVSLLPDVSAPQPTSDGVLRVFEDIAGRRIAVQLYPGASALVAALRTRGAVVGPVTPYAYASDTDTVQVREAIHALSEGRIGLVAFTATPQIERLFAVAREAGEDALLHAALRKTAIAAIGPVVAETLQRHGLKATLSPETSFHLKPLVRAIIAWHRQS